ncbi:MAG: LysR family transcriptional regulator substrate-binding protein, partial [Oscillospiraceae bacterium]|nr:LysR family transcriptional regulator substrate-binding protein [Oscillospiraceae bacterium]
LRLSAHDTWGLVLRRDHPLAQKESITPSDLLAVPLLISHQSQVRENLKRWLGRDPEELQVVCTFNLLYNAAIMVDEGLGCALALDKLVDVQETGDLCFRPLDPPLTSGLCVVWKKYQVFSRAAARFLEQLQQQFDSPAP